ncbi:hypothetical protein STIAU_3646 [Stigmatella aurantiaca DW4/3-1]|uniref:Uncharacterized protein n=1 Tax=Stigmatella aurantiaca (strain DW4/3-1) TaxID=378806 RepID=Q09CJ1_STIAD|nr:hypothetical protein STIAU_3646 [Stigmatella aurantiaca DW4/3-1]
MLTPGLPVTLVSVDMMKGEHESPAFLAKNPNGAVAAVASHHLWPLHGRSDDEDRLRQGDGPREERGPVRGRPGGDPPGPRHHPVRGLTRRPRRAPG